MKIFREHLIPKICNYYIDPVNLLSCLKAMWEIKIKKKPEKPSTLTRIQTNAETIREDYKTI
jgi:hypothetical protein